MAEQKRRAVKNRAQRPLQKTAERVILARIANILTGMPVRSQSITQEVRDIITILSETGYVTALGEKVEATIRTTTLIQ